MKKYTNEELCLIWIDSFYGLEYKHKQQIYKLIDKKAGIKDFISKSKDYIVATFGEKEYDMLYSSANGEYLKFILSSLDDKGITAITYFSESYPCFLKEIPVPPLVLYAKGDISLLDTEIFGIVGSRKSLPLSVKIAENFSKELSKNGFTLCTGIAEGIDVAVINSCLDCGGKVISVLAGGFDNIYPQSHINIFNKVAENGLVLSEYPPEVVAKPFHFPVRNRIIAGLSKGVLIVSAGIKSGTFYTAEYAEEYGKELFAIPYNVGISSGVGTNELIKRGARLVDNPKDILSFYGIEDKKTEETPLSEEERKIIDALKDGELHIDKICKILKKQIFEVTTLISLLEIKGKVVKTGFNVYALI